MTDGDPAPPKDDHDESGEVRYPDLRNLSSTPTDELQTPRQLPIPKKEPFVISVVKRDEVANIQKMNGLQPFRLEFPNHLPKSSSFEGMPSDGVPTSVVVQPYYLP